jgi:uncharacterized membrane protein YagU involved in acid resistance
MHPRTREFWLKLFGHLVWYAFLATVGAGFAVYLSNHA